jgi:hypothetical protein
MFNENLIVKYDSFSYKHKKIDWKKIIFHFENIYVSIGFMLRLSIKFEEL